MASGAIRRQCQRVQKLTGGLPFRVKPAVKLAVDISNYTEELTPAIIQAWKEAGVTRVIVRASTEDEYKIWLARQQMQAVIDAGGLELQAYAWVYFDPSFPPDDQALKINDAFLDLFGDLPITCLWLDAEDSVSDGLDVIGWIEIMLEWLIEDFEVGIYTSRGWWKQHAGTNERLARRPLWLAHWDGKPDLVSASLPFGGWTAAAMKQYAADTQLGGVTCDLNVYT